MATVQCRVIATTSRKLNEVLRLFGIEGTTVAPVRRGRVNKHWHVTSSEGRFVLRRYRQERSARAIQFELDVLEHAAARGWPVAPAVEATNGRRTVEVGRRTYALFPRLLGRAARYSSIARNRVNGELLARFHRDMSSWESRDQREGFGTAWEIDMATRALTPYATFNEMLRAFEREHRDLARAIRSERYENLRMLSRLGYGRRRLTLVHGDFHHDNLLFDAGSLTGLLDFDFTHMDERIADVATGIAMDCLAPPAYNELRMPAVQAFVEGYVGVSRLDDDELALTAPLIQASSLRLVAFQVCGWSLGGGEGALRSIERSVKERFPRLRRSRSSLEGAIRRGVERANG